MTLFFKVWYKTSLKGLKIENKLPISKSRKKLQVKMSIMYSLRFRVSPFFYVEMPFFVHFQVQDRNFFEKLVKTTPEIFEGLNYNNAWILDND